MLRHIKSSTSADILYAVLCMTKDYSSLFVVRLAFFMFFLVFSRTLQWHCMFRYSYMMLSVVISLSVTWMYCDKTAEARIMHFSLKCSPLPYSLPAKFDSEIRRRSLWSGAQTGVGWFSIEFATLYLGNGARSVSYTHLTLPTNREV